MSKISGNTVLRDLTVDEFRGLLLLDKAETPTTLNDNSKNNNRFTYGVNGLAKLLGCTLPTAQKIKNSGVISYSQVNRTIVFETEKILSELANKKTV